MSAPKRPALVAAARELLSSPRMAWTLSIVSIMTAVLTTFISRLIGWPGLIAIVVGLVLLSAGVLLASRDFIEWQGLLPISLLAFVAWCVLSIAWSQYTWASIGAVAYQLAFAAIGVTVALTRDTIQIVRAFGDCLRIVIVASLTLEVFAGLIIDTAVPGLGVQGNLAVGGPIQGLLGSRNGMGLVVLLAIVTFAV